MIKHILLYIGQSFDYFYTIIIALGGTIISTITTAFLLLTKNDFNEK